MLTENPPTIDPREISRPFSKKVELIPGITGVVLGTTGLTIDHSGTILRIYTSWGTNIFKEKEEPVQVWPKKGIRSKGPGRVVRIQLRFPGDHQNGKIWIGDNLQVKRAKTGESSYFVKVSSAHPLRPLLIDDSNPLNITHYLRRQLKAHSS